MFPADEPPLIGDDRFLAKHRSAYLALVAEARRRGLPPPPPLEVRLIDTIDDWFRLSPDGRYWQPIDPPPGRTRAEEEATR